MQNKRLFRKSLVAFGLCFTFCTSLNVYFVVHRVRLEELTMRHLMGEKSDEIRQVISKLLYKTEALSALVIQHDGMIDNFEQVAATIVDDPAILNILIAPNGIVSHVYPEEGNRRTLGFNLLGEGRGNREAMLAVETGQLVFGGPFVPVQGGVILVGRLPVFIGDGDGGRKFWGLVSVTLRYPDALAGAHLSLMEVHGFAYEIWRINPDTDKRQIIAHSSTNYNPNARHIEQPLHIFNAEWFFRILPVREWYEYPETWLFFVTGFGLSLLMGFFVRNNSELTKIKGNLERSVRTDSLTGLLNRFWLFENVERLIRTGMRFRLCYLDLNGFKQINDTHGHQAGDFVLLRFCDKIRKHIDENYYFARIAGDEFVLVKPHWEMAPEWWASVEREFAEPVRLPDGSKVYLSFSWGAVSYPEDGATIDGLVAVADRQMYEQKNRRYGKEKGRRGTDG